MRQDIIFVIDGKCCVFLEIILSLGNGFIKSHHFLKETHCLGCKWTLLKEDIQDSLGRSWKPEGPNLPVNNNSGHLLLKLSMNRVQKCHPWIWTYTIWWNLGRIFDTHMKFHPIIWSSRTYILHRSPWIWGYQCEYKSHQQSSRNTN